MTEQNNHAFISFEGGDGVGKTTQIKLLADRLRATGKAVLTTREPGGEPGAEKIRNLVLTGDVDRWDSMTEALLMTASRTEHVERLIKPSLAEGSIVLCDRFFDSSIVYQGAARGLGMDRISNLQKLALGDFKPSLTVLLELPTEVGLSRAIKREENDAPSEEREDRFERMGDDFHRTTAKAYDKLASENPDRYRRINAKRTIEEIHEEIWQLVANHLGIVAE